MRENENGGIFSDELKGYKIVILRKLFQDFFCKKIELSEQCLIIVNFFDLSLSTFNKH